MLNVQAHRAVLWVSYALVLEVGCGGGESKSSGSTAATDPGPPSTVRADRPAQVALRA